MKPLSKYHIKENPMKPSPKNVVARHLAESSHTGNRGKNARMEIHVEYVNPRTLRLMAYGPRGSSYWEARVGPRAAQELSDLASKAGFRIPVELIEEEIEQK